MEESVRLVGSHNHVIRGEVFPPLNDCAGVPSLRMELFSIPN
jgi:hypothetical protein